MVYIGSKDKSTSSNTAVTITLNATYRAAITHSFTISISCGPSSYTISLSEDPITMSYTYRQVGSADPEFTTGQFNWCVAACTHTIQGFETYSDSSHS